MKTYDQRMEAVQRKLHQKRNRRTAIIVTAVAVCLCVVSGILFTPYDKGLPDVQMHEQSDYYKVIQAINKLTYQKPEYDNLFDELINGIDYWMESPGDFNGGTDMAPETKDDQLSSGNANASVEITDHQVAGVYEGDLIKRSENHIFYLNGNTLEVYPIAGDETTLLSQYKLESYKSTFYYNTEMYLSDDANRLLLVVSGYGEVLREGKKDSFVQVVSLNVSDPKRIRQENTIFLTGNILSSRMVEGRLMILSQYRMDSKIDFSDESTFLPQYGDRLHMQSIPADDIVIPDELTNKYYTVVTLLDGTDLSMIDAGAFMSYSTQLYVSAKHIYATRSYAHNQDIGDGNTENRAMTEISCMEYGKDGLTAKGTFNVEGTVKDQYSMDEHNGIFRIVTGTSRVVTAAVANGYTAWQKNERNANLTCFKVGTWEQIAQIAQFAPEGETVESVRFDGDYAYVCTAVVITLTDPVFFFDMSDMDNIIVKDTGTINGYSSSLVQLHDGFLLGIGFNDEMALKVEIYGETATGVEAICEYVGSDAFASDYKAYYIDRENNLFGIPTYDGYILLQFDGYVLHELTSTECLGDLDKTRGVVIDQYLYAFGTDAFAVQKIN